jgi:hypothetical protein
MEKDVLKLINEAKMMDLIDEDGTKYNLKPLPGLNESELNDLEKDLPCQIPTHIRNLLTECRGIDGLLDIIEFTGQECASGFEFELFPTAIAIAHDGFGDYWVVDLCHDSTDWKPIYFCSHDPAVIVYQSPSLYHFIEEVIKMFIPPHRSLIDDVHEDLLMNIWRNNPGMITHDQALNSEDADIKEFAKSLDENYLLIDMRNAQIGDGFSWGRYGPKTVNKRFGEKRIFAYEVRKSFWQRLIKK